jgi:hypothetical protein
LKEVLNIQTNGRSIKMEIRISTAYKVISERIFLPGIDMAAAFLIPVLGLNGIG